MVYFNICRICLREETCLISMESDPSILPKIEEITSIQLQNGENFPTNICETCQNNLNSLYNFRKMIISNELELIDRNEHLQKLKIEQIKIEEIKVEINTKEEKASISSEAPTPRLHRTSSYKCNDCPDSFPTSKKLKMHRHATHVTRAKCTECGVVVREENLPRHVASHTPNPAKCKICGKLLKNDASLRGHMRQHSGISNTCHICGLSTVHGADFRRHMQRIHGIGDAETKSLCNICGKTVTSMRKHINVHTKQRSYKCEYCGKGLTSMYALKVHIRLHTKERPFQCQMCPLNFPQRVSLKNHCKARHPDACIS